MESHTVTRTVDRYVELQDIPVLRVRADMSGAGPSAAFDLLESRLPTIKRRRFYGSFLITEQGEEYFACVERISTDDPSKMRVGEGVIPGGLYARRKFPDWAKNLQQLPSAFEEMIRRHEHDPARPSLEFYRSHTELLLFLPVLSRAQRTDPP